MTRLELIKKIEDRKKQININIENLAKLSHLGVRTVNRFFAGDDVKLSTIERITNLLGLDFAGNEVIPLKELEKQRAKEKALFMASLVQSTSALEVQGLETDSLNKIIDKLSKIKELKQVSKKSQSNKVGSEKKITHFSIIASVTNGEG